MAASSTSQKHQLFVLQPMRGRTTEDVPGIGQVLARKMAQKGITKATQILGKFLLCDENETEFKEWIRGFGGTTKQENEVYDSMKEWCENLM